MKILEQFQVNVTTAIDLKNLKYVGEFQEFNLELKEKDKLCS